MGEMQGDQQLVCQCYMVTIKDKKLQLILLIEDLQKEEARGEPVELLTAIPLVEGDPSKMVQIESLLSVELWDQLCSFLPNNTCIFAWSALDMPRIPSKVIIHNLNVDRSKRREVSHQSNKKPSTRKSTS